MSDREKFLALLRQALESIDEERFFQDERAFQGALLQQLGKRVKNGAFPGNPIIEQEYQKRLPLHGIKIRPDIIVHVPFERGFTKQRGEGNFVAMELKRRATRKKANDAFLNLVKIEEALKYPLTVFINIDSEETYSSLCPNSIANQTMCFAIRLENGTPVVKSEECG